jgi:hypothetical protein
MIYHVYSAYSPTNPDTRRRMDLAEQTWEIQGWKEIPVPDSLVRRFVDDKSRVPYIRDIINFGCDGKESTDIVVLTNSDICCVPECRIEIVAGLMFSDAVCASRRDFGKLTSPLSKSQASTGIHYPGIDLFAFRVGWWMKNGSDYPDLLLGREIWDLVMFCLMERTNPNSQIRISDLIYHENHYQFWSDPKHKYKLKSQLHNISLGRGWLDSRGISMGRFSHQYWV